MTSSSTQTIERENSPRRKRWVHKRTLAVAFCVVVIPWILVAVPGEQYGGGGTSGITVTNRQHGWPFVHLSSTHVEIYDVEIYGNWGQLPPDIDANEIAANYSQHSFFAPDTNLNNSPQLNLRLHRNNPWWEDQPGFWSEGSNWPSWRYGWHLEFRPWGILCNFLFVGFVMVMVAIAVEFRIRRWGKLFRYSLKTTLVMVVIVAALLAYVISEHSKSAHEERHLQALKKLETDEIIYLHVEYQSRFPLLFSQLLNHGNFPWGNSMMFRQTRECLVSLHLDDSNTPEQVSQITKTLADSNTLVSVDMSHVENDTFARMLDELGKTNIHRLDIRFECYEWVYKKIGARFHDLDWEQAVKMADLKFETKNRFQHLESLILELDSALKHPEILQHFCDLPALQKVRIYDLSESGARYILQTRTRWPKNSIFDFAEDVSDDLKSRLQQAFPDASADDWD